MLVYIPPPTPIYHVPGSMWKESWRYGNYDVDIAAVDLLVVAKKFKGLILNLNLQQRPLDTTIKHFFVGETQQQLIFCYNSHTQQQSLTSFMTLIMEPLFHPGSSSPSSGNRWLGRILKGKLKKGFISLQHLQTGTNTGDTSNESNAERLTKMDSKLMATDQLLVTARRLDSAGRLIQDFIDYACSNKASISGIKRKSQQIKRGVLPMIMKASSTLEGIGPILAPAASTKYVFNRNECKRKRDVVDESSTLSPDLQLVMNYVSETDAQEITPPKKKRTIATRKVTSKPTSDSTVSLPEPKSGEYYTKTEVFNILSPIDKGSHKLASAMAEMVRLRYVPVQVNALQ